jgi:hypothetical protein
MPYDAGLASLSGGFGELRIPHQPFMPLRARRATRYHYLIGADAQKGLQLALNPYVDVLSRARAGEDQTFHDVSPYWRTASFSMRRNDIGSALAG